MDEIEEAKAGKRVPWSEVFEKRQGKHPVTLNLKVALYLYLLMRGPDYGHNIYKAFVKAEKEKNWENRIGLKDLTQKKGSSKVSAALNYMAEIGILCRYKDVKKYLPKSILIEDRIRRELKENPTKRIYYTINYDVIAEEGFGNINKLENISKQHSIDLGEGGRVEDYTAIEYNRLIWHAILIIQLYGKTEQDLIQYINRIPKFDYLTILLAFDDIIRNLIDCHTRNLVRPSEENAKREWLEKQKLVFFNDDQKIHQMLEKYGKNIHDWEGIYLEQFQSIISNRILREVRNERQPKN